MARSELVRQGSFGRLRLGTAWCVSAWSGRAIQANKMEVIGDEDNEREWEQQETKKR